MSGPEIDFEKYTTDERLRMLDRLWESLEKTPEALPVTDAQKIELDRRLADLEQNPGDGMTIEELERSLSRTSGR